MRGNTLAVPPANVHPYTEREKRLIALLYVDGAFARLSYGDVARILNTTYPQDNDGNRSGDGVYRFVTRQKAMISVR